MIITTKRTNRCFSTPSLDFYIPRQEETTGERQVLRRLLQYGCRRCLSPAEQELTRLRYEQGKTVAAIAAEKGRAPSSISRSLRTAREKLYRFTEEAGEIGQLCGMLRRQLQ